MIAIRAEHLLCARFTLSTFGWTNAFPVPSPRRRVPLSSTTCSISQMKELRHTDASRPAQANAAGKWGGGRLAAGLPESPAVTSLGVRGGAWGGGWCSLPRLSDQLLCAERTLQGVDSARNILMEVRRATTSQRQGPIRQQVTGAGFAQGRGQAKHASVGPTSPALAST